MTRNHVSPCGSGGSNPPLSASQSLSLGILRSNRQIARASGLFCIHVVAEKITFPQMTLDSRLKSLFANEARPALTVAPGVVDAATEHIALLLPRLRLVHSQRQRRGARIEALLHELQAADDDADRPTDYSDVAILRSVAGVGRIVAATIIAEASAALTERDYRALRCHAGIAPVTKQSGMQCMVLMRYACNGRLRHAFYHFYFGDLARKWVRIKSALTRTVRTTCRIRLSESRLFAIISNALNAKPAVRGSFPVPPVLRP